MKSNEQALKQRNWMTVKKRFNTDEYEVIGTEKNNPNQKYKMGTKAFSCSWGYDQSSVNSAQNKKSKQKEVWDHEERSRNSSAAQLSLETRK